VNQERILKIDLIGASPHHKEIGVLTRVRVTLLLRGKRQRGEFSV
jgi:hypothetical protein